MKIGMIGPKSMTVTWEQHLRFISDIHEVNIASDLNSLNNVDACLIMNETTGIVREAEQLQSSEQLVQALKRGIHILWIAPLPTHPELIRKCYEISEEAGVIVMFSMWAHYAPATRWLINQIPVPRKIHIHREWSGPRHTPDKTTLYRILLEEISVCLEWVKNRSLTFKGDHAFQHWIKDPIHSIQQLFILFGNGSTASIFLNPFGFENRHSRFVSGDKIAAVYQVNEQIIKKWLIHGEKSDTPDIMRFDYKEPARHLLSHFFRSVKTGEPPAFGINELNQLACYMQQFPAI